jgi:two-component system chemotaxis response regulator CheB
MPEMDGLTALRHMMTRYPRPVVMLSSATQAGAVTTLRALTIGAVDFVGKPSGAISLDFHRVREELITKIRIAASARVPASRPHAGPPAPSRTPTPARAASATAPFSRVVVIGASTGGPRALGILLPELPADGRTAYLIVQHMPAGFTQSLSERLDSLSRLTVREASPGDQLQADVALVAPGDFHVRVTPAGTLQLDQGPRLHGVRPAVDIALESVAHAFGPRALAVILTGMGQDGAAAALTLRQAGGHVLAEAASSCVVWGMPRAVVERGAANASVPLDELAAAIVRTLGARTPIYVQDRVHA